MTALSSLRVFFQIAPVHKHLNFRLAYLDPQAAQSISPSLAVAAHAGGGEARHCHYSLFVCWASSGNSHASA